VRSPILAVASLLCVGTARAQDAEPVDATGLLFEAPQWAEARPGATLTYRYVRTSANEALFGPSFEDQIRLHVEKGGSDASRTVRVELFDGPRRRASGPFEDVSANPVLILFLEHHVEQLSRTLHANPRYLKNAIRTALRARSAIDTAESSVNGRSVKIRRVRIAPFIDDPNKDRMKGLEGLVYTLAVSEQVPGQITELTVKAALPDGGAVLEEHLVYDPKND